MSLAKRFSRSQSQSHEGNMYLSKIISKIALASNFFGFSQTEDVWWSLCDFLSMDLQGPKAPRLFFLTDLTPELWSKRRGIESLRELPQAPYPPWSP